MICICGNSVEGKKYCSRSCAVKAGWSESRKAKHIERMTGNDMSVGRPKGSKNVNPYPLTEAVLNKFQSNPPPSWAGKEHSEETKRKQSAARTKYIQENGMSGTYQGKFRPLHPEKYKGDPSNIIYRSSWEMSYMCQLDKNPDVIQWSSEEMCLPYRDPTQGNTVHRYFPDFVVKMKDGKILMIEIKPFSQTQAPTKPKKVSKGYVNAVTTYIRNQKKWEAAQAYCEDKGWKFQILTENELGLGKKLGNSAK